MARWARWLVAIAATVMTCIAALWVVRVVPFPGLPHADADRWVVAGVIATIAATAVLAATSWWAQRDRTGGSDAGQQKASVRQQARASGRGSITQIGGDQHITGREKP